MDVDHSIASSALDGPFDKMSTDPSSSSMFTQCKCYRIYSYNNFCFLYEQSSQLEVLFETPSKIYFEDMASLHCIYSHPSFFVLHNYLLNFVKKKIKKNNFNTQPTICTTTSHSALCGTFLFHFRPTKLVLTLCIIKHPHSHH